jgi:hypothetical protein
VLSLLFSAPCRMTIHWSEKWHGSRCQDSRANKLRLSPLDPALLIKGVDPKERIHLVQGTGPKIGDLGVELLVELRNMAGGDVLDAHRPGQPLDFPGRDPVDKGLLEG